MIENMQLPPLEVAIKIGPATGLSPVGDHMAIFTIKTRVVGLGNQRVAGDPDSHRQRRLRAALGAFPVLILLHFFPFERLAPRTAAVLITRSAGALRIFLDKNTDT